ncbi:germ cell nuclear acidic protein [Halyomorpha halys]|uniref:germ cell nuclear acidic protein n=1 Tax=Halyomorpha halys TaxID=286706 RepID=UPI0006D5243F|nr:acidic repeat-containing protein [Halyomorpha halys]
MRAWLLVVGCCLWLAVSLATPVPPSSAPEPPPADRASSRQSADPVQPVAAAPQEEDDDDDDDDDDDVDLDLGDDDDDDDDDDAADDDDDDDDDEDYFERFFDDILGDDDDDDDDDDDEEVAAPAAPIVAAAPTVAPTAAPPQPSVPQGLAAASVEENAQDYGTAPGDEEPLETEATNTVVLTTNDQDEAANSVGSDDADDDETEDDDDEDDDDEDDDDDDDDLVGDIEAKQARSLNDADVAPPAYIVKYNRFVDTILDRINKILRKSYDPVNVRLQSSSDTKKNKNKKRKNKEKQSRVTESSRGNVTEAATEVMTELTTVASPASTQAAEPRKRKHPTAASPAVKNKTKSKPKSGAPRAKATLYGLSSIQREGDVTVNVMSSHTTVKTRFLVGPLVLKVEKEFGRGAKKELRSATATTAEMTGKLNLRVLNGGVATLHSIKVLQPKQVRVESPDDHDRTREFVWRRSGSIAKLVSEKLLAATKSMLQPPPTAKPTA